MKKIAVSPLTGFKKVKGLIGRDAHAVLIKTRFGIHTFGVRYPIDVVILDKANKIRVLKKSLKPNALFFWNPRYDTVLELPEGTIQKEKLKVGEMLGLHFVK